MEQKNGRLIFRVAAAMIAVALYSAMVMGASGDGAADRVLGQFDFTHHAPNLVDGKGMFSPDAVAIDASATPNRLYVADSDNNRVLGWNSADSFSNGEPADLVIGQPGFISSRCINVSATSLCDPEAVAVDRSGNSYLADAGNSRVLEYTVPPSWSLGRAAALRRPDATAIRPTATPPASTCALQPVSLSMSPQSLRGRYRQ